MKKILLAILSVVTFVSVAKAEDIDLNIVADSLVYQYYPETGDWYLGAKDETRLYTVHLDYYAEKAGKFGTFTYSDLDPVYSYVRKTKADSTGVDDYGILEGSTFTVSKESGYILLTGRLICSDGNTYILHGSFPVPEPVVTNIEGSSITIAEYNEDNGDWVVRFKNGDYKISLDISSPDGSFDGTYTEKDEYGDGCFVTNLEEDEEIGFETFSITMKIADGVTNPKKGCEITGTGIVESGDIYNFHMIVNPPLVAKDTVDVDVDVKTHEWPTSRLIRSGSSYYEFTEKADTCRKWSLGIYMLTGTATEDQLAKAYTRLVNTRTGDTITVLHGTILQSFDKQTLSVNLEAQLVMSDSIQYNIHFTEPIDTLGHVSNTFTDLWLDTSLQDYGSVTFCASNAEYQMTLSVNIDGDQTGESIYGTYDDSNASMILTRAADFESISSLTIISAEASLAADGSPVLSARILGDDMKIYDISASFQKPSITDTIEITSDIAEFYDNASLRNGFTFSATDDLTFSVVIMIDTDGSPTGHYEFSDISSQSSLVLADDDDIASTLNFYSGSCDVTYDGTDILLTGAFQIGNHYVKLRLLSPDVEPTRTNEATASRSASSTPIYNISGRRIASPEKGIIITNGHKYLVR